MKIKYKKYNQNLVQLSNCLDMYLLDNNFRNVHNKFTCKDYYNEIFYALNNNIKDEFSIHGFTFNSNDYENLYNRKVYKMYIEIGKNYNYKIDDNCLEKLNSFLDKYSKDLNKTRPTIRRIDERKFLLKIPKVWSRLVYISLLLTMIREIISYNNGEAIWSLERINKINEAVKENKIKDGKINKIVKNLSDQIKGYGLSTLHDVGINYYLNEKI